MRLLLSYQGIAIIACNNTQISVRVALCKSSRVVPSLQVSLYDCYYILRNQVKF